MAIIDTKNSGNINDGPGIQINGDGDNIIYLNNSLTYSDIYELLVIVDNLPIHSLNQYSLTDPADLTAKLIYNKAPKYVHFFDEYSVHLSPIDQAMDDLPNSARIVKKLSKLFLDVAERNNVLNTIGNGDELLDTISEELKALIKSDRRFIEKWFSEEKLDEFIIALLAYGVFKCKILLNPNER